MVEMLAEEFRVDVERTTEMGWDTALHLAAANGHRQVCFYLLTRYNANPNPQNRYKMTPLHYCRDVGVRVFPGPTLALIAPSLHFPADACLLPMPDGEVHCPVWR